MDAFKELLFRSQIERVVCERAAMEAENALCKQRNENPSYNEGFFTVLVEKLDEIEKQIRDCC